VPESTLNGIRLQQHIVNNISLLSFERFFYICTRVHQPCMLTGLHTDSSLVRCDSCFSYGWSSLLSCYSHWGPSIYPKDG